MRLSLSSASCLLLCNTLLSLLRSEWLVRFCDFGVVFGQVFADAEAVEVAGGEREHLLWGGLVGVSEAPVVEELCGINLVPGPGVRVVAFEDF